MFTIAIRAMAVTLALASVSIFAFGGPSRPSLATPPGPGPHIPGELLVKFQPTTPDTVVRAAVHQAGAEEAGEIPRIGVKRLKAPAHATQAVADALSRNPNVEYVELNYVAEVADVIPNDPYWPEQWGPQRVRAPEAWDFTTGSSSVVVAVVDTGIMATHPDLLGRVVAGYDFVNDDADPSDDFGHGTQVAGIIGAASSNSVGVAGIAWQSPILSIKVCASDGTCGYDDIAAGIIYATDAGAKVINLSLAGSTSSATLQDAVNYAATSGAVLVAAAGNSGSPVAKYPAAYANVIAVGSTGPTDERSSFSSYGSNLDVMAPGEDIISTTSNGGYWRYNSGTSFSSPHVAGAAALLWAAGANNSSVVTNAIIGGADDLGAAGWDQYFGWGRLNIHTALAILQGSPSPSSTPILTPSPTRSPTSAAPSPTPTATPTPTPTPTPRPTSTQTPTAVPSSTPASTPGGTTAIIWLPARRGWSSFVAPINGITDVTVYRTQGSKYPTNVVAAGLTYWVKGPVTITIAGN